MGRSFPLALILVAVVSPAPAIRAATPAPSPAHPAAPPEAAPDLNALYDTGKALFEALAPPDIQEQYEFPTREQWNQFAAALQQALADNSLAGLAAYEPQARAALPALRSLPGGDEFADWLEERLDYIEAAKTALAAPPASTAQPAAVPYLDLWRERLRGRTAPPNAQQLLPDIQPAFAAAGVPPQLAWLAEVESTFNPAARSPSGARGLFQLMPATAQSLGLSTWLPDERADPAKSARAAADYLHQLHTRFGSWPLALAAYNAGPGRVRQLLAKADADSYAAIAPSLPAETQMYVPKVLATVAARTGVSLAGS